MAAVLACGEGAVLSHHSAATLWGIAAERRGQVDVSIRRRSDLRRIGIRVRCRVTLSPDNIGSRFNIPVTSPVQTLIDIATELPPRRLERAVNEADKHGLVDPETLRAALDHHAGEPGVCSLRNLLDRDTFVLSDDELEPLFRPIALRAGLPLPTTKQMVNGFEVDFYWPDLGLVVETDGFRYHRTPSAQARDALRDQTHTAAGLTRLRFSHHHVKFEPARVQAVLTRTAANLRRT
jgi:very-short-patch-repair endonuclease